MSRGIRFALGVPLCVLALGIGACNSSDQKAQPQEKVAVTSQALAANGVACTLGSDCTSGKCVDGVCCNTTCGGGLSTDCQACSTAAGAAVSGTCGAATGSVCRPTAGACDAAETCAGVIDYRQTVSVTNPTGATLTDMQVRIEVASGNALLSANSNTIRFSDATNGAYDCTAGKGCYWLETFTGTAARIWVKIRSLPAAGLTLNLDYGNAALAASPMSNGPTTFPLLFDDFNNGTTINSQWTLVNTGGVTVQGSGVLSVGGTGDFWYGSDDASYASSNISGGLPTNFLAETSITAWPTVSSTTFNKSFGLRSGTGVTEKRAVLAYDGSYKIQASYRTTVAGASNSTAITTTTTLPRIFRMMRVGNNVTPYRVDPATFAATAEVAVPATVVGLNQVMLGGRVTTANPVKYDWVRVRQYVLPASEPVATISGSAQTGPSSLVCPTDVVAVNGTVCRAAADVCDMAETCVSGSCPAFDSKQPVNTACTPDANPCSLDKCDGTLNACQHPAGNSGAVCRAAVAGGCDAQETCTGASLTCPADILASNGTVCRASAGVCDPVAEVCNGGVNTCPADAVAGGSTVCRAIVAGGCDPIAETCGGSNSCPADTYTAGGTSCRAAVAGGCDIAETCTGASSACPTDAVMPSGATGAPQSQMVAEDGTANITCSSGTIISYTSTYGASPNGTCPVNCGTCTLGAASCAVTYSNAICGDCSFGFVKSGNLSITCGTATVCRAMVAGGCDPVAETCNGVANTCPADAVAPSTTACRFQTNICDAVEFCDGVTTTCPADAYAPVGTDCALPSAVVATAYAGGAPSQNALDFALSGYNTPTLTNAGPDTTWTGGAAGGALTYTATSIAGAAMNRYVYWKFSNVSYALTSGSAEMIEYDVRVANAASANGGIDIHTTSASPNDYFRNTGWTDDANPVPTRTPGAMVAPDLSGQAGTWVHRRAAVPAAMVGKTIDYWDAVMENDTTSATTFTAYYDNVVVTRKAGACDANKACKVKTAWSCSANADCATNVCNASALDASNIHRWNLETNANAVVGGQNGTVSGTPAFSGGGVVLTGTTTGPYVTVPAAVMTSLTNVTFEVWFSLGAISAATDWERVFDFGGGTAQNIFFTADAGDRPRVAFKRNGGAEVLIDGPTTLPSGTLTHAAVTITGGSSMSFYMNATLVGTVALGATDTLANIAFTNNLLGASQWPDTKLYGTIYDFRIYNKALSAAEVLAMYRKGVDAKLCIAQYAQGIACASDGDCISGQCEDSRCCATDCGNSNTGDCQACSIAAGAPTNGTCAAAANGTLCRPADNLPGANGTTSPACDLAEVCNGSATTCPADTQ